MKNTANKRPVDSWESAGTQKKQENLRSIEGGISSEMATAEITVERERAKTSLGVERQLAVLPSLVEDKTASLTDQQKKLAQRYCFVSNKAQESDEKLEQAEARLLEAEQKLTNNSLPAKYQKQVKAELENAQRAYEKAKKAQEKDSERLQKLLNQNGFTTLVSDLDLDNPKNKQAIAGEVNRSNVHKIKAKEGVLSVAMGKLSLATLTPLNAGEIAHAIRYCVPRDKRSRMLNNVYLYNSRALAVCELHEEIHELDKTIIPLQKAMEEVGVNDPKYAEYEDRLVKANKKSEVLNERLLKLLKKGDRLHGAIFSALKKVGVEIEQKEESEASIKASQQGILNSFKGLETKLKAGNVSAKKMEADLQPIMTHLLLLRGVTQNAKDGKLNLKAKEQKAFEILGDKLPIIEDALNSILDTLEESEQAQKTKKGFLSKVKGFLRKPKAKKVAKVAMLTMATLSVNSGIITDAVSDFFSELNDLDLGDSDFAKALQNAFAGLADGLDNIGDSALASESTTLSSGVKAEQIKEGDTLGQIADKMSVDNWQNLQVSEDGGQTWTSAEKINEYAIQPGWLVATDGAQQSAPIISNDYQTETVKKGDYLFKMLDRMPGANSLDDLEISMNGGVSWTRYGDFNNPNYLEPGWQVRTATQNISTQTASFTETHIDPPQNTEQIEVVENSGEIKLRASASVKEANLPQARPQAKEIIRADIGTATKVDSATIIVPGENDDIPGQMERRLDPVNMPQTERTFFNGNVLVGGGVSYFNGQVGSHGEAYAGGDHFAIGAEAGYASDNAYASPSAGYFSDNFDLAVKAMFAKGKLKSALSLPNGDHVFETEHTKTGVGSHLGVNLGSGPVKRAEVTLGYEKTSSEDAGSASFRADNGDLFKYDVKAEGATEKFGKVNLISNPFQLGGGWTANSNVGVLHESLNFDEPTGYKLTDNGEDFTTPVVGASVESSGKTQWKFAGEMGANYYELSAGVRAKGWQAGVQTRHTDIQDSIKANLGINLTEKAQLNIEGGATNITDDMVMEPDNYYGQIGVSIPLGGSKEKSVKPVVASAIDSLRQTVFTHLGHIDPKPKATMAIKKTEKANEGPGVMIIGANRTVPGKAEEYIASAYDYEGDKIVSYDFKIVSSTGFDGGNIAYWQHFVGEPHKVSLKFSTPDSGNGSATLQCVVTDEYGNSTTETLLITISEGQNPRNPSSNPNVNPKDDTDPGNPGSDPNVTPNDPSNTGDPSIPPVTPGDGQDTENPSTPPVTPGDGQDTENPSTPPVGPGDGQDTENPSTPPVGPGDGQDTENPSTPPVTPGDGQDTENPSTPPVTPGDGQDSGDPSTPPVTPGDGQDTENPSTPPVGPGDPNDPNQPTTPPFTPFE